jgi:hypothetical protein
MNLKKRSRMIAVWSLSAALLFIGFGPPSSPASATSPFQTQERGPGWVLLSAAGAKPEDLLGYEAAIDGDFLAASAPGTALPGGETNGAGLPGGLAGAVYVYQRLGEAWSEGVKLMAADAQAGDQFGLRVALSADTLAVGAPYKRVSPGGNAAGAVYIFQHQGGAWTQQARLTASDGAPYDLFGSALALQGDTLAVGARSADLPGKRNAGAVYVYQRQGTDWSLQVRLAPNDAGELDYFGQDLALSQGVLLIGAPGHDGPSSGDNFGAVYRFQRRGTVWRQAASLSVPDLAPNAQFGYALTLDKRAGILAVHAQQSRPSPNPDQDMENFVTRENYLGTVYVFERSGADWRYQTRLTPSQRPDVGFYFLPTGRVAAGRSALSGETIVLSMGFYGSYIFQRKAGQWSQLSPPEITFQAMGMHTMSYILTEEQDMLIFGSIGLSEAGAGILLVDLGVFK